MPPHAPTPLKPLAPTFIDSYKFFMQLGVGKWAKIYRKFGLITLIDDYAKSIRKILGSKVHNSMQKW